MSSLAEKLQAAGVKVLEVKEEELRMEMEGNMFLLSLPEDLLKELTRFKEIAVKYPDRIVYFKGDEVRRVLRSNLEKL